MRWCLFLSVALSSLGFSEEQIVYESISGGKSTVVEWSIQKEKDKICLKGKGSDKTVIIECLEDYILINYLEKFSPSKEFSIVKEGPCLLIKSLDGGKEKLKSFKIGKTPWVQNFKFGFQPFLKGSQKETTFYIVNPKDFDAHEMIATKEAEEEVEVSGKVYQTQKVKITLAGFKKKFWKAQAWFDQKTLLLVKYRANEGPGTAYTETFLIEGKEGI